MRKFWLYFTNAYGVLWLVVLLVALITNKHIDTGVYGLIGFPIAAFIYALVRLNLKTSEEHELKILKEENEKLKTKIKSLKEKAKK